jgi:hypothetical protein
MENLNPTSGINAFITRGSNGTRSEGLSNSELKTMRGGDGYGMTTESAYGQANAGSPSGIGRGFHNSAGVPIAGYKSCGLIPDFKLGAGRNYTSNASIQKGAGKSVAAYNQYGTGEYGYTRPGVDGNRLYAGSYAPITNLSYSQTCGGRKKAHKSRKRKKKAKRKKHRGGYAQFRSNIPLTRTMQLPATASGDWQGQLATPPPYSSTDLCNNNYNHYTGKNSPSPVLDQGLSQ